MHELINNPTRHAFARGKGEIPVKLARTSAFVDCRVLYRPQHSLGSRGSIFLVAFPYGRTATLEWRGSPSRGSIRVCTL
jgi:two-component sensor histidine kinase